MGWSHAYVWQLRIGINILTSEVPTNEGEVPAPQHALIGTRCWGRTTTSNCENFGGFHLSEMEGCWSLKCSFYRTHTWSYLLTDSLGLSSSAGHQFQNCRKHMEGIWIFCLEWGLEEQLSFIWPDIIVLLLRPPSTQPANESGHWILASKNSHPILAIPYNPCPQLMQGSCYAKVDRHGLHYRLL